MSEDKPDVGPEQSAEDSALAQMTPEEREAGCFAELRDVCAKWRCNMVSMIEVTAE